MSDSYTQIISTQGAPARAIVKAYLNKVYAWMAASMAVTAGAAVYAFSNPDTMAWCEEHILMLCIGTLALVFIMRLMQGVLPAAILSLLFLAFSAMEGLALTPLLAEYSARSIGITFACTAGMFGGMSFYGMTTKRDLSGWGRWLFMSLIGLIIAGAANAFWGTSTTDMIISCAGVLVFSCLTAYHTQGVIQAGLVLEGEERAKGAVFGALALYLAFLNLFLYLLRLLGDRD